MTSHNPQAEQMAAESMLRTLSAQAEATWFQEEPLLARYELPATPRIVDVGCGPGEISARLLERFEGAELVGVDLEEAHLERARVRCADFGARSEFVAGNALALGLPDDHFDLSVCRHLLQAVPSAEQLVAELVRVTRPGGVLHLVAEDYAMMHFHPTRLDTDRFWREGPMAYAEATGTDLRSGRKAFHYLCEAGLEEVRVDYLTIDTVRVPRQIFARIWSAWRDGYTDAIAEHSELTREQVVDHWQDMIACIENPKGYAVWQLPVISGRLPRS